MNIKRFILFISCIGFAHGDIVVPTTSVELTQARIIAGQFLSQTTMGATPWATNELAKDIVAKGENEALNTWLDDQFDKDVVNHYDYGATILNKYLTLGQTPFMAYYQEGVWWDRSLRAQDQLRQRVAWGLSQIIVAGGDVSDHGRLASLKYYDLLQKHAFGDYRELLTDVTYSPLMGTYLSSVLNGKGDDAAGIFADENYAREVMQLFSMGIYDRQMNGEYILNKDGSIKENYTNDDIKGLARVMTGLVFADRTTKGLPARYYGALYNHLDPMLMNQEFHDTTAKTILGEFFPAGGDGNEEIARALDIIAATPSVPPYMSMTLIKRLTSSNPSSAYIERVANVWKSTNGNLKEVVRAIYMDEEARNTTSFEVTALANEPGMSLIQVETNDELGGRQMEPALRMVQFYRLFKPESVHEDGFFGPDYTAHLYTAQRPMYQTSVFNDFSAEYSPGTGPLANYVEENNVDLVMPESELMHRSYISQYEYTERLVKNRAVTESAFRGNDASPLARLQNLRSWYLKDNDISKVIKWLNLYACQGRMSMDLQEDLATLFNRQSNASSRFDLAVNTILNSTEAIIID